MSKYSSFFLLSSPEYEKLGDKLRLRKYGSWLAEEAWLREEQSQKRALFTLKAIDLARKIAKDKGIEDAEAFELLQNSGMIDEELMGGYAAEATALMESMPSNRAQLEQLVTIFFRNRGEVLQGKKWEATDDWTEEDTKMLPKVIIQQVENFMVNEDSTGGTDGENSGEENEKEEEAKN
jgi:hypothetical protein